MWRNDIVRSALACGIGLGLAAATAQAGPPPISTWAREWQPVPTSWALADLVAVGAGGAIYVATRPDDGTGQGNAIGILKYEPDGTLAWQVIRDGRAIGSEGITDIEATDEGVAAIAISLDAGGPHPLILDYAADGSLRWDAALPGPVSGGFLAPQLAVAHDGQRLVAFDDGATGSLLRYTPDGELIDSVPLAFSGFGGVSALDVDGDLNAIVVSVNDFESYDIQKIDLAGDVLWSYADQGIGLALSEAFLAVAPSGDIVVTGSPEVGCVPDGITVHSRIWRLHPDGMLAWSRDLPADGCDFQISTDLILGPEEETYLLANRSVGDPSVLTRIDADGSTAWTASHAGDGFVTSFSEVAIGAYGDVFVGGRDSTGFEFLEPRVLSFSPEGELQWSGRVSDEVMFVGDLQTGDDGSVVIVGTTRPVPSGIDDRATVIRLDFPACAGDLDDDGVVGVNDILALLAAWGSHAAHPADFNGDGEVDVTDLLVLLAAWGPCA